MCQSPQWRPRSYHGHFSCGFAMFLICSSRFKVVDVARRRNDAFAAQLLLRLHTATDTTVDYEKDDKDGGTATGGNEL